MALEFAPDPRLESKLIKTKPFPALRMFGEMLRRHPTDESQARWTALEKASIDLTGIGQKGEVYIAGSTAYGQALIESDLDVSMVLIPSGSDDEIIKSLKESYFDHRKPSVYPIKFDNQTGYRLIVDSIRRPSGLEDLVIAQSIGSLRVVIGSGVEIPEEIINGFDQVSGFAEAAYGFTFSAPWRLSARKYVRRLMTENPEFLSLRDDERFQFLGQIVPHIKDILES